MAPHDFNEHRTELRDLRETMEKGFTGVHTRLDTQNGRIGKGEVRDAEHDVKIRNLEREIFRRRWDDAGNVLADIGDEFQPRRAIAGRIITDRDVKIVWLTLGGVVGAVEFGLRVVPWMVHLMAGKP